MITGRICLKSPPNTKVIPPKGASGELHKSLKVRSTVSITCLCCIGASSQITKSVMRIKSACSEFFIILQIEDSWQGIGILKQEWAVRPPFKRSAAIPEGEHKAQSSAQSAVDSRGYYRDRSCLYPQAHAERMSLLFY